MPIASNGQIAIIFIGTFSNDGITPIPGMSWMSQPVLIDLIAGSPAEVSAVRIINLAQTLITQQSVFYLRLPWRKPPAKYMKVACAVLTSGTVFSWDLGPCEIAMEYMPDSEAPNGYDLG